MTRETYLASVKPNEVQLMPALEREGYRPEVAIADIVDNSISAESTIINIDFNWNNGYDANIVIRDNGFGMSEDRLKDSMTLAYDFNKNRTEKDLGRFGMGLKMASFSLGKRLSIVTKSNELISNCVWDISYENEDATPDWTIKVNEIDSEIINNEEKIIETLSNGTTIVIEKLKVGFDKRYTSQSDRNFTKIQNDVRAYLALVFHRFLENKKSPVQILMNNTPVVPWNPFFKHALTQEVYKHEMLDAGGVVEIKGYVMPNPKHLTEAECRYLQWNNIKSLFRLQGFYIYRNKRLIKYGDWLGILRKKDNNFNLARIRIDITACHDESWNIDIKKSDATPPTAVKNILYSAMSKCTAISAETLNQHSTYNRREQLPSPEAVWEARERKNHGYSYFINRTHPIYKKLVNQLSSVQSDLLKRYLDLIENFHPIMQMEMFAESDSSVSVESYDVERDLDEMKKLILLLRETNYDDDTIKQALISAVHLNYLKDKIDDLLQELS